MERIISDNNAGFFDKLDVYEKLDFKPHTAIFLAKNFKSILTSTDAFLVCIIYVTVPSKLVFYVSH